MTPAQMVAFAAIIDLPWMLTALGLVLAGYLLGRAGLDKFGDRTRLVNPPKEQQPEAAAQPQPVSISERRTGT